MRVRIILEDPTLDEHVAKPIVEQVFRDLGRKAQVNIAREPHLRGIAQALDPTIIGEIFAQYPMDDLFLLVIDRDCDRFNNDARAKEREVEHPGKLLAILAWQELETWMLALHRGTLGASWTDVRAHCDPKEAFARPFLETQGWSNDVGRGRKRAMKKLGQEWKGLLSVCPELDDFKQRLAAML